MTKSLRCFMHWYSDSICSKIEENGSDLGIVKIDIFDKWVFISRFKSEIYNKAVHWTWY